MNKNRYKQLFVDLVINKYVKKQELYWSKVIYICLITKHVAWVSKLNQPEEILWIVIEDYKQH